MAIPPKFLYDGLGCRLFEAICELPEYYPSRTEAGILRIHAEEILEPLGGGSILVDLGAGDCGKALQIIPVLRPTQYVPVDVSEAFLGSGVEHVRRRFPELQVSPVTADLSVSLPLPRSALSGPLLFFYPGSSIGNFAPSEAMALLERIFHACQETSAGGGLLIGVDLMKEAPTLKAAYNDSLGVTAAFNLNVLHHVNRSLGANFKVDQWQHEATFNFIEQRIEMHLVAKQDLLVTWKSGSRRFARGEKIHTENSYKYSSSDFVGMLERCGFREIRSFTDPRKWFMVCHARLAR